MAKKPKEEIHLRKKVKPLPVRYTPNVTPLIDVMFLLLLFFLLTTKFRQEEGAIPGTLPALGKSFAVETAEDLPPPINITINPVGRDSVDASYQVSGVEVSVGNAEELYKDLLGRGKAFSQHELEKVPVVIKPRSDVRWGFVVEAFNQTYRAKYRCILFAPT